jgi:hypothetical protein
VITDGTLRLSPLRLEDAAAHLAGEDAELVRWLYGGPGTLPGVILAGGRAGQELLRRDPGRGEHRERLQVRGRRREEHLMDPPRRAVARQTFTNANLTETTSCRRNGGSAAIRSTLMYAGQLSQCY